MKSVLPLFLVLGLAAPAAAAGQTVADDPLAQQVTALGGTLVWSSGEAPGQKLMQRSPEGVIAPVTGTGQAASFRSPDLGRDAEGRLVLTYARCATLARCTYVRDDLAGGAVRIKGLEPERCAVSSTPSVWGSRVAYGLSCFKRSGGQRIFDAKRSGLYVKTGSGEPRRLRTPRNARRAGSLTVDDVDLRGRRVAAIYSDIYEFAVIQSVSGRNRHSTRAAASEGDGEQTAAGLTVGTGAARMWFLTRSSYAGDPPLSIIHRRTRSCEDWQTLVGSSEPDAGFDYPRTDLTVDAGRLYAVDPGTGIVEHAYEPRFPC